MNNPPQPNTCPQCRAVLLTDAPQGLCPACLLAAVAEPTEAGTAPLPKAPPPTREQVAAAFPHLEILELIGAGGMGYVFKARQPKLDRLVALKLLPQSLAADPAFAGRFEREGRILARLSHSNIVTVHDFGFARAGDLQSPSLSTLNSQPSTSQTGFYYLLMEFVDGVNLRQAMRAGRFTPVQALEIVPRICEALQFAHEQGILHRDIKPENILLDAKGRVKLVDFGIAKLVGPDLVGRDSVEPSNERSEANAASISGDATPSQESRFARASSVGNQGSTESRPTSDALTSATAALGTPSYMAPEQRDRPADVDHRADIYSLGVVFYEMLTGELPVGKFAPPSAKSASDPRVDEVVLRALEQQRERRQQSAGEVKTQVETIASTPGSSRREEAHSLKPSWFKPVGLLYVLVGLAGWLPTVASLGSHRVVGSFTVLLSATGLAFLTCHRWWRWLAIGCNALVIVLIVFNELWVLALAAIGKIPPGAPWPSDFGGVAAQMVGGVPNSLLLLSSFGAGVWALLRADARAAFDHQPASQQEHRVIGALAVLALAGGLLTFTVARHLTFDPVVFGLKAAGVLALAVWCLLRDRAAGTSLRLSRGWGVFLGALATLALVICFAILIGGSALSEWLKNSSLFSKQKPLPAAHAPAATTNAPAQATPAKPAPDLSPKQITFTDFKNLNGSVWLTAKPTLGPGESFQAWLVLPDGTRELGMCNENVFSHGSRETGISGWGWQFQAPFSSNRTDEVVTQLRERWEGKQLACPPGQPVTVFTLTNEAGLKISGEVQFNRTTADPAQPAVAAVMARSQMPFGSMLRFTSTVPDGHSLHVRATGTEVHAAHPTLSRSASKFSTDAHCSWHWTDYEFTGMQSAAAKQMQALFERGPLLVTNGQPRTIFSVTNANGKVYSGQFELRGPGFVPPPSPTPRPRSALPPTPVYEPPKPSTSEGLALMAKLREHYDQATNLVIEGQTVTTMLRTNQPPFVQTNQFEIKLGRPSLYQVRWTSSPAGAHVHKGAAWSDGVANWFWMNGSTPEARASRELALGRGVGVSQNVTGWLPTLFFGKAQWVETLGDFRLEPDADIEGEPCAVLVGTARGNPTRLWISKRDHLLRQVEFLNTISAEYLAGTSSGSPGSTIRTVQTYHRVVTGQALTADDFKFNPAATPK